tara:strand:+ start:157 stop:987 length:831 start_codon:yes stop_codon:yes gene_type:complete
MADLSFAEEKKFEMLFGMFSGYVLDFSNRTFEDFFFRSIQINIYDEKFNAYSGSKANRLRAFWKSESNYLVGKLLKDMVEYAAAFDSVDQKLLDECRLAAERLLQCAPVPEIDAITPNAPGPTFEALAKSVREAIENNEPETGLDRLHTFVVKYFRAICEKHSIPVDRNKPLHSMVGGYVKFLDGAGLLHSEMSKRILKSSIQTMEAFNHVRNNQSFAHDNEVLNRAESLLIYNHVTATIRFIETLESPEELKKDESEKQYKDVFEAFGIVDPIRF